MRHDARASRRARTDRGRGCTASGPQRRLGEAEDGEQREFGERRDDQEHGLDGVDHVASGGAGQRLRTGLRGSRPRLRGGQVAEDGGAEGSAAGAEEAGAGGGDGEVAAVEEFGRRSQPRR
jgi:hypothetical protein